MFFTVNNNNNTSKNSGTSSTSNTTTSSNSNAFPGFFDLTFTDFSSKKFPLIAQNFCDEIARTSLTPFQEYECNICHHSFPTPIALEIHTLTHGHYNFGKESNNNNTSTRNGYIQMNEESSKVKSEKLKKTLDHHHLQQQQQHQLHSSITANGPGIHSCPICSFDCGSLEELVKHIFHHKLEGITGHASPVAASDAASWSNSLTNDKDGFMALLQLHNRDIKSKSASMLNSQIHHHQQQQQSQQLKQQPATVNEKVVESQQVSVTSPKQVKRSASPVDVIGDESQHNISKSTVKLSSSSSYTEDEMDEDEASMEVEDDMAQDESSLQVKTKDGNNVSQVISNTKSHKISSSSSSFSPCSSSQPQSDLATIESIISIKNPLENTSSIHNSHASPLNHSNEASLDYEDEDEMVIDDAHVEDDDDGEDDASNEYNGNNDSIKDKGRCKLPSLANGNKLSPVSFSSSNGSLDYTNGAIASSALGGTGSGVKKAPGSSTGSDAANCTPVSCTICKSEFKSLCALKKHSRSHVQGGHNYQCHLCPYTSLDKSTLVRHLRTHNGERPFKCLICKFAFTTKSNCERHVRKRHKKTSKSDIRACITFSIETAPSLRNPDSQLTSSNLINGGLKSGFHQLPSSVNNSNCNPAATNNTVSSSVIHASSSSPSTAAFNGAFNGSSPSPSTTTTTTTTTTNNNNNSISTNNNNNINNNSNTSKYSSALTQQPQNDTCSSPSLSPISSFKLGTNNTAFSSNNFTSNNQSLNHNNVGHLNNGIHNNNNINSSNINTNASNIISINNNNILIGGNNNVKGKGFIGAYNSNLPGSTGSISDNENDADRMSIHHDEDVASHVTSDFMSALPKGSLNNFANSIPTSDILAKYLSSLSDLTFSGLMNRSAFQLHQQQLAAVGRLMANPTAFAAAATAAAATGLLPGSNALAAAVASASPLQPTLAALAASLISPQPPGGNSLSSSSSSSNNSSSTANCNNGTTKPFTCTRCNFGFSTKNNCLRHIRKQHPEVGDKAGSIISTLTPSSGTSSPVPSNVAPLVAHGTSHSVKMSKSNVGSKSNGSHSSDDCYSDEGSYRSSSPLPLVSTSPIAAVNLTKKLTTGAPLDLAVHALDLSMKDHQQQQQQQQNSTGGGFPLSLCNLQKVQRIP